MISDIKGHAGASSLLSSTVPSLAPPLSFPPLLSLPALKKIGCHVFKNNEAANGEFHVAGFPVNNHKPS